MLIRNRIATLERIEASGWEQTERRGKPADACTLTAHLSDGTKHTRKAVVSYKTGEREKLFVPMLEGKMTEREGQDLMRLVLRRCTALQTTRGELQREFGKGLIR